MTELKSIVNYIGTPDFPAETGRYHLYVSHACPYAHRVLILRALKGLNDVISVTVADTVRDEERGWSFQDDPDPVFGGKKYIREIYQEARPEYVGRFTVPLLVDKKTRRIVCNESGDIIKNLNTAFDALVRQPTPDLYPEALRSQIDEAGAWAQTHLAEVIYKLASVKTQEEYEAAFDALFTSLDELEARLGRSRFLVGSTLTLADVRLFSVLIRFDVLYHGLFKANLKRIADLPNTFNYLRELYQLPGVKDTVHFDVIKRASYVGHKHLNPSGIVPKGPFINLDAPHNRSSL